MRDILSLIGVVLEFSVVLVKLYTVFFNFECIVFYEPHKRQATCSLLHHGHKCQRIWLSAKAKS